MSLLQAMEVRSEIRRRVAPALQLPLLLVFALLASGCAHKIVESGMEIARDEPVRVIPGYLTGIDGNPRKDKSGRCWRTVEWRPILAIEECDPSIYREVKKRKLAMEMAMAGVSQSPTEIASVSGYAAQFEGGAPPEAAAVGATPDAAVTATANAVVGDSAAPAAPDPAKAAAVAAAAAAQAAFEGITAAAPVAAPVVPRAADMSAPGVSAEVKPGYVMKPVVLNTDAAFFFGKDRLTPAGKDAVENLAAYIKLWGIQDVNVEVVGHSDRIGNAKDNLALSKRRADAVKEVMVAAGVPTARIAAIGRGSDQPVTTLEQCPLDLDRCELIGCLAPDRRVEVGLKGRRKTAER